MNKNASKINDIIEKSGNNFHYEVVKALKKYGWDVIISPYYNDNLTSKPREIDIIAEKLFKYGLEKYKQKWINVRLFIECKHIKEDVVFWFDKIDLKSFSDKIYKNYSLRHDYIKNHRFLNPDVNVAKLFASNNSNNNDFIFKGLNQSLNSMINYREKIILALKDKEASIKKVINYPLLLCNNFDNFYKVDVRQDLKKYNEIYNNFQIELNYSYLDKYKQNKTEYFLIDIVDFTKLEGFLDELEELDINIIKDGLKKF